MLNIMNSRISKNAALTISFGIALALGAQVSIPFYPVPFTLQTMIFTVAVLYNSRIAMQSMLLYIFLGIIGLPVFAQWSNFLTTFKSPSIGYIAGMLFASGVITFLHIKSVANKLIVLNLIVFACGLTPLVYLFGVSTAVHAGLIVFIIPEIIKTIVAYGIYRYIK